MSPLPISSYQIGIVCALPKEMVAVLAMLDEEHEPLAERDAQDHNTYILGRIHKHNVVVACLPAGIYGTNAAAFVANNMLRSFPSVRVGLMVGIGGAIPNLPKTDIRLGDVVVSQPDTVYGGVVQYDLGKSLNGGRFERKGSLDKPPMILLTALSLMQVKYRGVRRYLEEAFQRDPTLLERGYASPGPEEDHLHCAICGRSYSECKLCANGLILREDRKHQDPVIHYGTIASGNQVVKDANFRDQLGQEFGAKCVEMEAAGLMNNFPCLIVRGICDYADSYKTDKWQEYAALTAAAFAKELLLYVIPKKVTVEKSLEEIAGVFKHQVSISKEVLDETRQQSRNSETSYLNDMHQRCHQGFKTTTYEEFKNINPERVPGTCEWALKHPAFLAWCSRTRNDLLWISADPGCGKSVLARSFIDIEFQNNQNHVCYFFFKDNEVQNNLSTALCAVLHQLFAFAPHLIAHAMPAWEINGDKPLTKEVDEMWRIFMAATKDPQAPSIICVFDALDECQETDRKRLIGKLTDFYKTTSSVGSSVSDKIRPTSLKFLVTSRPYDDIRLEFQLPPHLPSIQLRGEEENKHIRQEINIVIKTLVNELATNLNLKEGMRDRLETQLLEMEHHTYLWLHLAIKSIYETFRDSFRPDEESIERLPRGIEDAYERILSKASKRTQNVKLILQIIVGAKRALTVGEMAVALGVASKPQAITLKDVILDKQNLGSQIRHWCGLFVFISDSRIYLIHQTAKEFLIRVPGVVSVEGMWKHCLVPAEYEVVMAQVCVRLLLFSDINNTAEDLVRRWNFGGYRGRGIKDFLNHEDDIELFVAYSAGFWAAHVQSTYSPMDKLLKIRVLQLYDSKNAVSGWWEPIFWGSLNWLHYGTSALCLAALNGHIEIVSDFLNADPSSIHWVDSLGYSALIYASQFARLDVVKLLLDKEADINVQGLHNWMTALLAASQEGHPDVVQLLLSEGADPKDMNIHANTALHMASEGGHYSVVKLLLNWGAHIDAKGEYRLTALHLASANGHHSVVELLLSRGADTSTLGSSNETTLHVASEKGHVTVVELLLSKGVDIDARRHSGETALHMACEEGHLAVVELLISKGAIIDTQGDQDETPLCTASKEGYLAVVELLISKGANVNSRGCYNDTALHAASKKGHLAIVELLLSNGADINARGYHDETAVYIATKECHLPVVELLLNKGADVNGLILGRYPYKTVLQVASSYGYQAIVDRLTSNGAT